MEPKSLKDVSAALALALNEAGFLDVDGKPIDGPLQIIEGFLSELIPEKCATLNCRNEARYNSGFCGICDVVYNGGKGIRKRDLDG